jgi:hypothetical protein
MGSSLKDPKRLLEGEGRYVRHIKVRESSAIDERAFAALLRQAAGSRKAGPKSPSQKASRRTGAKGTGR